MEMIDKLFPIFMLLLGAVLGAATSIITARANYRHQITKVLLEKFMIVRDEVTSIVSEFALLLSDDYLDKDSTHLSNKTNELLQLYYKYYDFLPKEVLIEMNCLFVCLKDKKHRIHRQYNGRIVPMSEEKKKKYDFIKSISLVDNFVYYALLALSSNNEKIRHTISIKCQARSVLTSLNTFFTLDNLFYLAKYVYKTK